MRLRMEMACWALALIPVLASCEALATKSPEGGTVVDPTTGVERDRTVGDDALDTALTVGGVALPAQAPLLGLAGLLARGAIGMLKREDSA